MFSINSCLPFSIKLLAVLFFQDMAPRSQAQKAHLALITSKRVAAAAESDSTVKVLEAKLESAD